MASRGETCDIGIFSNAVYLVVIGISLFSSYLGGVQI